jgi:hypothetical protein
MNRVTGDLERHLRSLFLYIGGFILICLLVLQMEITQRVYMHTIHFYSLVAMTAPPILAGVARAARFKWGATAVAAVYTLFLMLIGWILPLFPAEPKLGPVYHQVTQFVPPEFPMLLIIPAFVLDLMWQRTASWGTFRQAVVSAAVFLAVFALVQWPFAGFLMTPAARNGFFGTKYFGYYVSPQGMMARYRFVVTEAGGLFWKEAFTALITAVLTTWLGLGWGNWMRRIRR